jgi:hypothetical protein
MYNLSDYIPHSGNEDKVKMGNHKVLAWSLKSGYHFTEAGFCFGDVKIIAIENI